VNSFSDCNRESKKIYDKILHQTKKICSFHFGEVSQVQVREAINSSRNTNCKDINSINTNFVKLVLMF
jgi:hypothetical protein